MKQIWFVAGTQWFSGSTWPLLFETKELAERFVRDNYPDEDPDKRYSRIFYREYFTQEDFDKRAV